jgi:hypothetical protein
MARVGDRVDADHSMCMVREEILRATDADVSDPELLALLKNNNFVRVEDGMGYDLFSYRVCSRCAVVSAVARSWWADSVDTTPCCDRANTKLEHEPSC